MSRIVLIIYIIILYLYISHSKFSKEKKAKLYIFFVSLGLVIDSGFRHLGVGPDTYNYYEKFEEVKYYSFKDLYNSVFHVGRYDYIKDAGYWLFQKSFQYFSSSFRIFLIFIAILFFSSLARFIYSNMKDLRDILMSYIFYIGMFWYFFSTTGCRQTIAVSIVMFGATYLEKGQWLIYVGLVFLASMMHVSAIVSLLAIALILIKSSKIFSYAVPLLIPIIYITRYTLFSFLLQSTNMNDRFSYYLMERNLSDSIVVTIFYLIIILLCVRYREKLSSSKETNFCMRLFLLGMCFLPTMYIDASAMRITFYFTYSMYVIVPRIVKQLNFRDKYAFAVLFMIMLSLFSIRKTWDYNFFWESARVTDNDNRSFYVRETIPFLPGSENAIINE